MLSIKAIKSTSDKVDRVTFHPVQPWLAYADRTNAVTVWNYESNEVRYATGDASSSINLSINLSIIINFSPRFLFIFPPFTGRLHQPAGRIRRWRSPRSFLTSTSRQNRCCSRCCPSPWSLTDPRSLPRHKICRLWSNKRSCLSRFRHLLLANRTATMAATRSA